MGALEADIGIVKGEIVESIRLPFPRDSYYTTIIVPGFSDSHAHPQVIDAGLWNNVTWRDSYEWIRTRRLLVDEVSLRKDVGTSSKLSALTLLRALLEGTTLIAITGRLEANLRAINTLPVKPRVVVLPTVLDKPGWPGLSDIKRSMRAFKSFIVDGFVKLGVFSHSLGMVSPATIRGALGLAAELRSVMGIHLGEGVPELDELLDILGSPPYKAKIVAVHCISDSPEVYGIQCVSCPVSNMLLYGRTIETLSRASALGSDWPLILGTLPRHLPLLSSMFSSPKQLTRLLAKSTIGGYLVYRMPYSGDLVGYDDKVQRVLEGGSTPKVVSVGGEVVVSEGRIAGLEASLRDVEKWIDNSIREALELHGSGGVKELDAKALISIHRQLMELKSKNLLAKHAGP